MEKSTLILTLSPSGTYHTVFGNNHGRKLYFELSANGNIGKVEECFYLDRQAKKSPKKLTEEPFSLTSLLEKICAELDKSFERVEFSESPILDKNELISEYLHNEKKHVLLLLKEGNTLRTIFRNRHYRSIHLEIKRDGERALISVCRYCDTRSGTKNSPQGLKTIFFDYSLPRLLHIVNSELEGGFTDIAIAEEYTVTLSRPICGRI